MFLVGESAEKWCQINNVLLYKNKEKTHITNQNYETWKQYSKILNSNSKNGKKRKLNEISGKDENQEINHTILLTKVKKKKYQI